MAAMDEFLAKEEPSLGPSLPLPRSTAPWRSQGKSTARGSKDSAFSKHLAVTTALHIIGGGDHRSTNSLCLLQFLFSKHLAVTTAFIVLVAVTTAIQFGGGDNRFLTQR